jgi:GNAT superfamily N-acetyltransferase
MLIRRATHADREGVYYVHVNAVRVTCAEHYAPHEIDGWVGTKRNESYALPLDTCDVFVAIEHDHVVGFSQLNPTMYEVEAVYVDPAYLRRGIGAALLVEVETSAWSRGLRELRLAASLNAVPFYASCGFVAHAEAMYRLNSGISIRCVPMTKQLNPPTRHSV